jgi:hypothetical protein
MTHIYFSKERTFYRHSFRLKTILCRNLVRNFLLLTRNLYCKPYIPVIWLNCTFCKIYGKVGTNFPFSHHKSNQDNNRNIYPLIKRILSCTLSFIASSKGIHRWPDLFRTYLLAFTNPRLNPNLHYFHITFNCYPCYLYLTYQTL